VSEGGGGSRVLEKKLLAEKGDTSWNNPGFGVFLGGRNLLNALGHLEGLNCVTTFPTLSKGFQLGGTAKTWKTPWYQRFLYRAGGSPGVPRGGFCLLKVACRQLSKSQGGSLSDFLFLSGGKSLKKPGGTVDRIGSLKRHIQVRA